MLILKSIASFQLIATAVKCILGSKLKEVGRII